jgi:hypothetical protein
MASLILKMAEDPEKNTVLSAVPFLNKVAELRPEADAPPSDKVKLVKVAAVDPGLVKTICSTGTFEAPWIWVVLPGAPLPWEVPKDSCVGVKVVVAVGVKVEVNKGVLVAVGGMGVRVMV